MPKLTVFEMKVSKIYPLLVQKAQRKGRTKEEVDQLIKWLTGYNMDNVDMGMTYAEFFNNALVCNAVGAAVIE